MKLSNTSEASFRAPLGVLFVALLSIVTGLLLSNPVSAASPESQLFTDNTQNDRRAVEEVLQREPFDCNIPAESPTYCPPTVTVGYTEEILISFSFGDTMALFALYDNATGEPLAQAILDPGDLNQWMWTNYNMDQTVNVRVEVTSLEGQNIRGSYEVRQVLQ